MNKSINVIKNILFFLSKNSIFCVLLLWLMIILIIGTLSQKEIGLYTSQERYFTSNFICLFNLIPLPGGKLTLILIFIGLCVKLINETWAFKKIGILLIHVSVLMLLLGGIITASYSKEGFIIINQGEKNDIFVKKNDYDIIISDKKTVNFNISKNNKIHKFTKSLNIKINKYYINSNVKLKKKPFDENVSFGISRFFDIYSLPTYLEDEENKFAVSFYLIGKTEKKICYLIENKIDKINVLIDGIEYFLNLVKSYEKLPFSLHLVNFEKQVYEGTDVAKSYISKILIEDNNIKWKYDIKMNKPLKYKGYIFYQTSFIENKFNNTTVLTVTKDYGELFPYISCVLLFFGFLFHIFKLLPRLFIFKS